MPWTAPHFARRLADIQTTRFYLAELATEIEIAQTFVDRYILDAAGRVLDEVAAAMANWWARTACKSRSSRGGTARRLRLQTQYQVARDYLDSRVETVYGGATEVMKEIIGRRLVRD